MNGRTGGLTLAAGMMAMPGIGAPAQAQEATARSPVGRHAGMTFEGRPAQ